MTKTGATLATADLQFINIFIISGVTITIKLNYFYGLRPARLRGFRDGIFPDCLSESRPRSVMLILRNTRKQWMVTLNTHVDP
jgi:hypothetical protein